MRNRVYRRERLHYPAVLLLGLFLAALMQSCGGTSAQSTSTATPVHPPTVKEPATPTSAPATDQSWLVQAGYTPDRDLVLRVTRATLHIYHSVCTGSADGKCQEIDVFRQGIRAPILRKHYTDVNTLQLIPAGFSVSVPSYAPGDPLCCPSRAPVTDRYVWNGKEFTETGPTPGTP